MTTFEAIAAGNREKLEQLLRDDPSTASQRNEQGISALMLALYHRKPELADVLVAAGAPIDAFELAALGRADEVCALLDQEPALLSAFSSDGFTMLHYAAFFGHDELTGKLLARGADPSLVARNPMKVQPLHSAVAGHHVGSIRALLDAGAPVNDPQEGGWTPLHAAAHLGDAELIQLMLQHGADPQARADDGHTPSDKARAAGHDHVLLLLG